MANVERYKDSEGRDRYAARWRQGNKQMKARRGPDGQPFKSQRAAMKYAQEQEADARRGLTPVRSDATLSEYALYWVSTRSHRPETARRIKLMLKHFEATGLGERRLADVRQSMVQGWASDRAQVLAPSTVRKLVTNLGGVFRSAVNDNLIIKSPVVDLRLPEDHQERIVPLTVAQVRQLAATLPARYRAMVITQAGLGLRRGELLGLRVEDVDLDVHQVYVRTQFTSRPPLDEHGNRVRTELKTRSSRRDLPLPPHVAHELAHHLATYGAGEDGSVFTTTTGQPVSALYYGNLIVWGAAKAGLPKGTTSHDLRHHYATELLGAGLTNVEVGHLLGHKDGVLVSRVYGHSRVDALDRARDALNAVWAS